MFRTQHLVIWKFKENTKRRRLQLHSFYVYINSIAERYLCVEKFRLKTQGTCNIRLVLYIRYTSYYIV